MARVRPRPIPHCRLLRADQIKTGMQACAIPVAMGLSGKPKRRFSDVVRTWPGEDGTVWIRQIVGYGKTWDTRHAGDERLMVQLCQRAPRRKRVEQ